MSVMRRVVYDLAANSQKKLKRIMKGIQPQKTVQNAKARIRAVTIEQNVGDL